MLHCQETQASGMATSRHYDSTLLRHGGGSRHSQSNIPWLRILLITIRWRHYEAQHINLPRLLKMASYYGIKITLRYYYTTTYSLNTMLSQRHSHWRHVGHCHSEDKNIGDVYDAMSRAIIHGQPANTQHTFATIDHYCLMPRNTTRITGQYWHIVIVVTFADIDAILLMSLIRWLPAGNTRLRVYRY